MKCILHIGTEKTGTTTLQEFFFRNRLALSGCGVEYPLIGSGACARELPVICYDTKRRDDFTQRNGLVSDQKLVAFQAKAAGAIRKQVGLYKPESRVVFCSEHIQSRLTTKSELVRLKNFIDSLGFSEVMVVVYLREQVSLATSLYSTLVIHGGNTDTPPLPDSNSGRYYEQICNHRRTLETFSEVFNKAAIVPLIFDRDQFIGNSIVNSFLHLLGIKDVSPFEIPVNKNFASSQLTLDVIREINRTVPRLIDGEINLGRRNITMLVSRFLTEGSVYQMPKAIADHYRTYFSDGNEWVRRKYFPEQDQLFKDTGMKPASMPVDFPAAQLAELIAHLWKQQYGENRTRNRPSDILQGLARLVTKLLRRL